MLSKTALLPLAALPVAFAQNGTITWSSCAKNFTFPASCGTLAVPLDYTDTSSTRTLNLSLMKAEAKYQPSRGSILINPGGPGNGAVAFLEDLGEVMQVQVKTVSNVPSLLLTEHSMTGGHFDVIAVDPRGTGTTLQVNCYQNPLERGYYSVFGSGYTNSSDTALGLVWAREKTYADSCYENIGDIGELMGTGFVARDFIQVVDALGEDGLLRYWGQSYGTVLGATLAAMFPDRIDRMVIDGVANIADYTDGWEYDPGPVGDVVLKKYLEECVRVGAQKCPLAKDNATTEGLLTSIYDFIEQVKFEPVVLGSNVTTDIVTRDQILSAFNIALRVQIGYAIPLAHYIDAIFERNLTAYHFNRALLFPEALANDALPAIRCSDTEFRTQTLDSIKSRVERLLGESQFFGDTYTGSYIQCSRWKFAAKGRHQGSWKAKTKNPALIIGSPYDLRTPIVSAYNASANLEGSVVLQHNGYGHCVLYSPGACAIKAVQDYFTNGTLPQPGTTCEQDYGIFSGKTIFDSFGVKPPTAS